LLAEISTWASLISNAKWEKQFQFVQTRQVSAASSLFQLLFPYCYDN